MEVSNSLLWASKELDAMHCKCGIVPRGPLKHSEDVDVHQSSGFHDQAESPELLPHGGVSDEDHLLPGHLLTEVAGVKGQESAGMGLPCPLYKPEKLVFTPRCACKEHILDCNIIDSTDGWPKAFQRRLLEG